ncbi:MAG: hypothetical protein P8Y04_13210 [Desulfobulbaceae bacterium]
MKEMPNCFDFFPADLAVNLGYFYQDINQQVNKCVVGLGLGPLIGANLTFNIKGKGPEGSNAAEQIP